ncbi:thiamine diphosphokinase [Polaribacter reichenbachii]|uniref:Thiamine diphosphokinase n=1 Tax=Polaribacter reichenbachii TaxID=996801 RepID=A0A1B8TW48_9FLAO|nr:thiamine diphosphokinase [Polaribacter reichenbachii]APZ45018.1 thiamine diphosphokinase [Polaribacter reichenbachii]AUC18881.1 thiamine diphosphokinase [Polaribacter reichenbachii]OBY63961.1 thiamine pyrophosphokinase [Polaribacter reichenbachii]
MKQKKVFLLLNGEPPKRLPKLSKYDIVCATDGAYQYLKEQKIKPDFISGDFDSLPNLPNDIEIIYTPDQNYTDFDKILKILADKGFLHIDIFGASGKEQDHFLGNLHTAIQWKKKLKLTFFDEYSYFFLADKITEITGCKNKIISLLPLPITKKITTKGLQYSLNNEDLQFGERIGTRNKAIKDEVKITFESGELFIFINHKKQEN